MESLNVRIKNKGEKSNDQLNAVRLLTAKVSPDLSDYVLTKFQLEKLQTMLILNQKLYRCDVNDTKMKYDSLVAYSLIILSKRVNPVSNNYGVPSGESQKN